MCVVCLVCVCRVFVCAESLCEFVKLYNYYPYGPYRQYRASGSVQCSYTTTPPMDRTACTEPQCLYSAAIPLLPLWTVQPVQSLSACTRLHFTFSLPSRIQYSNNAVQPAYSSGCYTPCKALFSPFVRPRPDKFFFHKTNARFKQIYS